MTLKASQYVQTGARDVLSVPWVREAVELIHGTQADDFAGTLSLLYAGDRLVAGHIGMRSKTVWHYHFPAYDINAAKYSPGLNLLLRMAAYAPSVGLTTIDLGKARADYKERVMNRTVDVTDGRIDLRPARPLPRLGWEAKSLATRIMLWSPFRGQI